MGGYVDGSRNGLRNRYLNPRTKDRRCSFVMKKWPPQYDRSYRPSAKSKFCFTDLETMAPEEREQKVILPKLRAQLKEAYQKSGLYKKKWDRAGIKPQDV